MCSYELGTKGKSITSDGRPHQFPSLVMVLGLLTWRPVIGEWEWWKMDHPPNALGVFNVRVTST